MHFSILLAFLCLLRVNSSYAAVHSSTQCEPLHYIFDQSTAPIFYSHFTPISPKGSYALTSNGLELYLDKPDGHVTNKSGVNDKISGGATVNSTFVLDAGKVTVEVQVSPLVSGVIVAWILIGDKSLDEVDVELICGERDSWQTNLFVQDPNKSRPEYGMFSSKEKVDDISKTHAFSIEVDANNISWGIDGRVVRTLTKDQCTTKDGFSHYPSHSMRVQLGIWDASSPAGTAAWGKGPIDWEDAPNRITTTFKSIKVECD
ncbi:glycoside hydrolase family 16 protein [Mycena vitilis]|nr:glycoside hydrolase family 16 protein [Mycena vitilis]